MKGKRQRERVRRSNIQRGKERRREREKFVVKYDYRFLSDVIMAVITTFFA